MPFTRLQEEEWQRQLTHSFFMDLNNCSDLPRLAIFFDYYEKAHLDFKQWLNRIFLPAIFSDKSIIAVIAGREEIEHNQTWRGQRRFYLNGLSETCFHLYAEECGVYLDPNLISEFHKLLRGRPKFFVEYVRSQLFQGDWNE